MALTTLKCHEADTINKTNKKHGVKLCSHDEKALFMYATPALNLFIEWNHGYLQCNKANTMKIMEFLTARLHERT